MLRYRNSFGKVYTVFPLKQVFVTSVVIFTLGSLLCTVAPTSAAFITGRAIAGFGSSGIGAVTILSRLFPLQKRPLWLGIVSGVQSVALVSAPLIGGALIDSFSWRACFGINLPVGGLAVILIIFSFHDPMPHSTDEQLKLQEKLKRLDLIGTLVIVPCITCLLLALQWGGTRYGWNNAIIISLLVIFGTLLAIFGFLQYKFGDEATLPPKILKNRSLMAGAWFQACCDGTLAVTEYYIAIYFQGVRGFTATKSGALGLPMIIGLMISTISAGFGTTFFGYYTRTYTLFFCAWASTDIYASIHAGVHHHRTDSSGYLNYVRSERKPCENPLLSRVPWCRDRTWYQRTFQCLSDGSTAQRHPYRQCDFDVRRGCRLIAVYLGLICPLPKPTCRRT
jgi:MFS family permease